MRNVTRSSAWLLAALVTLGCDTDQPLQVGERAFTLTVTAPSAQVPVYNVWDVFEDNDNDQMPDDQAGDGPDVTLWCELASGAVGSPISVPWHFFADIRVLRAGEVTPEQITSPAARNFGTNVAEYDEAVLGGNFQASPPLPPGTVIDMEGRVVVDDQGTTRRFRFANARRLTIANRDLILSTGNFLNAIPGGGFGGVCPGIDLGPAGIDGEAFPYTVELSKGDTILVDILRFPDPPAGIDFLSNPSLSAQVRLDGLAVGVQGPTSTSDTQGSGGFSFSFTAQ